ncbi:MAG: OadG family protein [Clostridia bacterium]|nr:OadG family protein [Clostridia bacterium]
MAKILLSTGSELAFVCFFGVAVVFCGLVILIGLIYLMNLICDRFFPDKPASSAPSAPAPTPAPSKEIANRGEVVAAVCAAIAEKEGTDISAIRVISFKKLN